MTSEIPNSFEDDDRFTYMKVNVPDDARAFLPDVVNNVFPFLDAARAEEYVAKFLPLRLS